MAQTIKLKRSAQSGASGIPSTSDLALGEVGINTYHGKMYIKKDDGTESIVDVGGLPLSGGTLTGNLNLGDNVKLQLGNQTNGDLQIYHDGSASYIKENGTGDLIIQGSNTMRLQGSSNQELANFSTGGAVTLFNNGSAKIATTATGADITGVLTADGLTVDAALATINAPSHNADLILTEGGTNTDARIRNSNGILEIDADLNNEFGNSSIMFAVDGTDKLKINNNGDISFYDGSGNQGFFWDSSASRLGLGTTSLTHTLHVTGSHNEMALFKRSVSGNSEVKIDTTTAGDAKLTFANNGTSEYTMGRDNSDGAFKIADGGTIGSNDRLTINADGSSVFSGAVTATGLTVSTTYPKLQLNSTSGVARNFSVGTNNETFTIRNETASSDSLTISNANIVNIPQSLMVGATTAPLSILHIGSGADANVPITLAPATGGNVEFRNTSSTGSFTFTNANGSSEKLEINSSGNATFSGSVSTGNMTLSGQEIDVSSGDLTLDVAGDIILDADGGDILLKDGGAHWFNLANSSGANLTSMVQDADILLRGNDGGSIVTALTLDMSAAGAATFNSSVTSTGLTVSKTASGSTTQIASFVNPVGTANTGVRFWMSGTNTTTRGTFIDAVAESTSNNHTLRFGTSASSALPVERMRIDSSGNLLVGTTDTTIYNNLSGDGGIVLAKVTGGGRIDASRAGSCYTANRLGSDGQLFDFRKNGGIVGRISTVGNDLVIGSSVSGHKGVRFGSSYIAPINTIDAFEDNTTDLGSPAVRFKDLYLSNNATAQKLTLTKAPVGTYTIEVDGTNTGQPNLIVKQSTSERLRIDNQGRVGIGTSAPAAGIHLTKSSSSTYLRMDDGSNCLINFSADTNTAVMQVQETGFASWKPLELRANYLVFKPNNTETMRLTSTGLGIGTSSPDEKVDITGGYLKFNGGDYGLKSSHGLSYNANEHYFIANGSERVRIDSQGRVGIGQTSLVNGDKLTVNGNFNLNGTLFNGTSNNSAGLNFTSNYVNMYGYSGIRFYAQAAGIGSMAERMRVRNDGNVLIGKTADDNTTAGHRFHANGFASHAVTSDSMYLNRLSTDGAVLTLAKDGSTVGSIGTANGDLHIDGKAHHSGVRFQAGSLLPRLNGADTNNTIDLGYDDGTDTHRFKDLYLSGTANVQYAGATDTGIYFNGSFNAVVPYRPDTGVAVDDYLDLGVYSHRWDDIFATNGTIQTSDRNEKQDIESLTEAEERVAVAAKGLLKKFRWKNAVEDKGDDARIHFGIIAQDLQAAFEAEGLNAGRYGMFTSNTWTNEDGEEQTRMGVRYSELLAFIISAI